MGFLGGGKETSGELHNYGLIQCSSEWKQDGLANSHQRFEARGPIVSLLVHS